MLGRYIELAKKGRGCEGEAWLRLVNELIDEKLLKEIVGGERAL
jgi:hypothetical protein